MRRRGVGLVAVAIAATAPATASAQARPWAWPPAAAGGWALGALTVRFGADGLAVTAGGRTRWSSPHGGFVAAARARDPRAAVVATLHAQILRGDSPAALIRAYTQYAGRMRPMPDWVGRGAIVGIQGGTDVVRRRVADLEAPGVPLAGVWLQDWVGQRITSFGSRLLWNWTLNTARYSGWEQMVADLRDKGIRVMTYINPMLADAAGIPGPERNLYAEAIARGYVIRRPTGEPYLVDQGGFTSALIDLTSAAARGWTRGVLRDMAVESGASGWMADFAEQTPFDGRFANGASGAVEHNRFPDRWSEIQASALARLPDVVDFHRAAYATSPGTAWLLWDGRPDRELERARRHALRPHRDALARHVRLLAQPLGHGRLHDARRAARGARRRAAGALVGDERVRRRDVPHPRGQPAAAERAAVLDARGRARLRALGARVPGAHAVPARARARGAPQRMPIVRPLWMTDARLDEVTQAFTLGREVLVAPAFSPGAARTTLPLPTGAWEHVWSGRGYRGGRIVTVDSRLGEPAVFVRAGSPLAATIRGAARR